MNKEPNRTFWQGFREGLNPCWGIAWLLYGMGHCLYLLGDRCHLPGIYRPYNALMLASRWLCERFGFSSPWDFPQEPTP